MILMRIVCNVFFKFIDTGANLEIYFIPIIRI